MQALIAAERPPVQLDVLLSSATPARLLAVCVLLASCGAGLAYTHDPARIVDEVGRAGGFHVRSMELIGQRETSDSAIIASVGLDPSTSLLGLDVASARKRLEALPWVTEATVRKVLPGTLKVKIDEAAAFARWSHHGETVLIAHDGAVLADAVPARFSGLPLVAGEGANEAVDEAVGLLKAHPFIAQKTLAVVRINRRRWDLSLESGATVRLPADRPSAALHRLAELETEGSLLASGRVVIDLRLPDRTAVALDPDPNQGVRLQDVALGPLSNDPLAAAIRESAAEDTLATAIAEGVAADPLAAVIEEMMQ